MAESRRMPAIVIPMRFSAFERRAHEIFEEVPEEFLEGIAGPVVERRARPHPHLPGIFTLGECVPVPHSFTLGEEHLSTVFLYWGSFLEIGRRDPGFDMQAELEETVLHEIRHHIEDRAGAPDLRNEDAAEEEEERRRTGLPFRDGHYRLAPAAGPSLWSLHGDLFLQVVLRRRELAAAREAGLPVSWRGRILRVEADAMDSLPAFVSFPGEGEAHGRRRGDLWVVVRER